MAAATNAKITVSMGEESVSFELDGYELSETKQRDGSVHRYLNNASKDFIADEVEKILLTLRSL